MSKLESKQINFKKALDRLKEAVEEYQKENASDVVRDGVIQRFEFTYELSWKTAREYMKELGIVDLNAPKPVIKEAFAQKWITNEENWLLMLSDRNMTSHVYREEMAEEIAERIASCYVQEFEQLLTKLTGSLE
ncbi:nucleotidyltransferase substrate binding protein [Anoxynatronum buryatiense]|uniref:Nucleotidyltransferase substrate binding protein, HI0074 family n=1 Tax=Anoxynatronum buryatiense TaxID=489973 RepID=A0AA46AJ72_9CLOT|nr:nucleotidyltransferase substrate binding protein [Anoxynatronum buryatiense]SMP57208.1 nucleotidyltransferase substrate binding protein, HI0074 family [Anoxynatronum buryatiense]